MTITIATLAVDLQNDFTTGTLAVPGAIEVCADMANYMIQHQNERLLVASMCWHRHPGEHWDPQAGGYVHHCEAETWGAELAPEFGVIRSVLDVIVRKGEYDAAPSPFDGFDEHGNALADILGNAGITTIEVGGVATDVCVLAGVLDGLKRDFEIHLLPGLTAAIGGVEGKTKAIRQMLDAGALIA